MPPNLTSFCLASTFDTLPSPANLKRWRITTEAMCTLCSKGVCITAHILGACKVSLQQGRNTFWHDTVLHKIIESRKSFILNIKQAVLIFPKSSIKFVKKGIKVPHKRTPPVGILHQASDWVLPADIDSNYCFPIHIAYTQLKPDITIFSNVLGKVMLIEVTCPCEENMESWHSTKINKYFTLKTTIESNGWSMELFAVEVSARGYCLKSVLCCLKKLGFNNTLIRNKIKNFSKSSMECSFCIWLARNNKEWTSTTNLKVKDSMKESCNSPSPRPYPKQNTKPVSKANSICLLGFINKGNTYCANSILQVLSVKPTLWNRVPSESNHLSPMLRTSSLSMAVKKNSTTPIDPSNLLWALKRNLSSTRVTPFDFNSQQDVAEILQVVLDELKGVSLAARSLISNRLRTTVSCNTCLCSSVSEENLDILPLQVSTGIKTSLKQFLSPEILSSGNKWFCPSCKTPSDSTRETCVMNSAPILAIQLCHFSNRGGQLVKDETFVSCTQSQLGQYLSSHNY